MKIYFDKINNIVYKEMDKTHYFGELESFIPSYNDSFLPKTLQQRYKVRWKSHSPFSYEHDDFYTEADKENWSSYIGSELESIISFYKRIKNLESGRTI